MSSSLQQQLQKLRQAPANLDLTKSRRISFLFDAAQAALLDLDTIYALGIEGLNELTHLDPRFGDFQANLFAQPTKEFERQLQTKDVNDKLDKTIHSFLQLVSQYFLLKSAHKALEYLIRRYR
jgi:U3 small nucleolar RNA-associated protein 10